MYSGVFWQVLADLMQIYSLFVVLLKALIMRWCNKFDNYAYALKSSSSKIGSWKTTKKYEEMTARTKNFNAGVKLLETVRWKKSGGASDSQLRYL